MNNAPILPEHWIVSCGIPAYLLTDQGTQFVIKFFQTICSFHGLESLLSVPYQPQSNKQTELFNAMIIARFLITCMSTSATWISSCSRSGTLSTTKATIRPGQYPSVWYNGNIRLVQSLMIGHLRHQKTVKNWLHTFFSSNKTTLPTGMMQE